MTYFNQRASFEAVRSLASGSIAASYANVGSVTTHPARIVLLQNMTDAGVMISFDGGVTDNIPLAANTSTVLDLSSDAVGRSIMQLAANTQIAVKRLSGAPTTGSFYVSVVYANN